MRKGGFAMNEIFERRSIRRYTDKEISDEDIKKLLKAGMNAPSAHNKKPYDLVVVKNKETLKKLADKEMLIYDRYGSITMTEKGLKEARLVVSKHMTLQNFFEEVLGLDTNEASQNACRIEHVISEQAFNKISEFTKKYTEKK